MISLTPTIQRTQTGGNALPFWFAIALTLVLASGLDAVTPQSLDFTPGKVANVNFPNTVPYRDIESFTLDLRVHGAVQPDPLVFSDIVSISGFRIFWHVVPNVLLVIDDLDSFTSGQGQGFQINVAGRTDFLLRLTRDYANRQLRAEIWNVDGTNRVQHGPLLINTVRPLRVETLSLGGAQSRFRLDYVRMRQGAAPLNAQPPSGAPTGDIFNFELNGNGANSVNGSHNLGLFSGAQFVDSPLFPPVAIISENSRVVRAGHPQRLDASQSYSPNSADPLQFQWEYLGGPEANVTPVMIDAGTSQPQLTGMLFGTHQLRLTLTDTRGQVQTVTHELGAVATDHQGLVIPAEAHIAEVAGPLLRYGLSPWRYYEERSAVVTDHFGALQSNPLYLDTWNTPLPGTISIETNSKTVTGVGTSFQQQFCNGGTAPTGNTLVLYYPRADGQSGRRSMFIESCQSETQMTFVIPYYFGPSLSNAEYSQWAPSGFWLNGSTNLNYYDNVLAFYIQYYRTGLTRYRDYARTLADRWWNTPYMDGGYACDGAFGAWCLAPRLRSLTGIYLRALDGKPENFAGLRKIQDVALAEMNGALQTATIFGDVREAAYELAFAGLCAMLDPDPVAGNKCADALENAVGAWKRLQRTDSSSGTKYWDSITSGNSSWNSQGGTSVTMTNGSPIVVGAGTNFLGATTCIPTSDGRVFAFRSTEGPFNAVDGDTDKYYIKEVVSATQLVLDRPYQGATAAGRGWQCGLVVGNGVQPFMMGIVASALNFAEKGLLRHNRVSRANEAQQMLFDAEEWFRKEGYRPQTKGFWYARYFPNCEPIGENADPECLAGGVVESREYALESLNGYAQVQVRRSPDDPKAHETQVFADNLFGGIFGKFGGPGADGFYSVGIDDNGTFLTTDNAKYLGFIFGFGFSSAWPAARLGKLADPPSSPSTLIDIDLQAHEATSATVLLIQPNGVSQEVNCSGTPCALPVDARQGPHWYRVSYQLPNGETRTDPQPRLLLVNSPDTI